jgi:hypothetical protein
MDGKDRRLSACGFSSMNKFDDQKCLFMNLQRRGLDLRDHAPSRCLSENRDATLYSIEKKPCAAYPTPLKESGPSWWGLVARSFSPPLLPLIDEERTKFAIELVDARLEAGLSSPGHPLGTLCNEHKRCSTACIVSTTRGRKSTGVLCVDRKKKACLNGRPQEKRRDSWLRSK